MKKIGIEKSCRRIDDCLHEIKNSFTTKNTVYVLIKPAKELCALSLRSTNYSKSTKNDAYMVFAADKNGHWIGSSEKGYTNLDNCMPAICGRMKFPKATWAGIFDAAHKR